MRRNVRKWSITAKFAVALALVGLVVQTPTRAAVVVNTNVPFTLSVASTCFPEIVVLTGSAHILQTSEVDSNGGIHFKSQLQSQGISGVGMITGVKYQGMSLRQTHTIDHSTPALETTFRLDIRVIGQGPANNFSVQVTMHITINANGEVTANVVNTSFECQ
jgi:hypothetical protein